LLMVVPLVDGADPHGLRVGLPSKLYQD